MDAECQIVSAACMRAHAAPLLRCHRLTTALATASLIASVPVSAQAPADALERTITVSVRNEDGKNLRGLEAKHFRGQLRGRPVQILSAEEAPTHRVVMLYDISGSMVNSRPAARLVAERFLALMPPQVPLAFLSFALEIHERITFNADRSQLLSQVRTLEVPRCDRHAPRGACDTALFDAVSQAADLFGHAQPGDSIVLITDGGENASRLNKLQIRQKLSDTGLRLFCFFVLEPLEEGLSSREELEGNGQTVELSRTTGGEVYIFNAKEVMHFAQEWPPRERASAQQRLESLLTPIETMVREMNGFYVLEIRLPEPLEKAHGWKLEVVDPQTGKLDHHLILHYPSQLMPSANAGP